MPATDLIGSIVIVIDALDESGDITSRKVLLSILAEKTAHLPSNFRVFVTARAEEDIQDALVGNRNVISKFLDATSVKSTDLQRKVGMETPAGSDHVYHV
jgi:hypothetical protein